MAAAASDKEGADVPRSVVGATLDTDDTSLDDAMVAAVDAVEHFVPKRWYAVRIGRDPGLYTTWLSCQAAVHCVKGAQFKSFKTREEAESYLQEPVTVVQPRKATKRRRPAGSTCTPRPEVPKRRRIRCSLPPLPASPLEWHAYFDGGSRGNPGIAGGGAALLSARGIEALGVQGCGEDHTNNQAEACGALLVLELMKQAVERGANPSQLTIHGDSKLIVNMASGRWKAHDPILHKLVQGMQGRLAQLPLTITWQYVPRKENSLADALSNVAMDSVCDATILIPETLSSLLSDGDSASSLSVWDTIPLWVEKEKDLQQVCASELARTLVIYQ